MKFWKKCVLSFILLIAIFLIYILLNIRNLEIEQLNKDIHIIRGAGGNTVILNTDEGAVVVDSMTFKMQGSLIREHAERLTGKDVILLINTHYHLDHTHGNPGFNEDIIVASTERTLSHLKILDTEYWQGEAEKRLPNDVFKDQRQFKYGNKTISLFHLGRGHTDGDLVVLFEEDKTLVMGDLFFNRHYPNIDLEAGGSVQLWPSTIENALALNADVIIPGHGKTSTREGLKEFQTMMAQLAEIGRKAARDKTPLKRLLESEDLDADSDYTAIKFAGFPLGLDREFVLRRAWEESTGNYETLN